MDPFFEGTVSNSCPANCAGASFTEDPLSGITTVEYTFNSTIPSVVAGDVLIELRGTTTVTSAIRFEDLNSKAVAFVFSNDSLLPDDVGLPAAYQANTLTISQNALSQGIFTPTAGQPGYCSSCGSVAYGLQDVPKSASLALFGAALTGLGAVRRRRGTA